MKTSISSILALAFFVPFATSQLTTVSAQGRHVFDADAPNSAFNFSGKVTISGIGGNIVGKPSTFNVSGDLATDLTVQNGILTSGKFVAGRESLILPTLKAVVPNPIPFLPALASLTITNAEFRFLSVDPTTGAPTTFPIGPATGSFTTTVVSEILSGTVHFTALGQTPQTIQLAGLTTNAQSVSGIFLATPKGFQLNVPLQTTFSFADPGTGATGSLSINGSIVANDRDLAADTDEISLAVGGTQTMTLSAGTGNGGRSYFMLGSLAGTTPGVAAGTVNVPLNHDGYMELTLSSPNGFPLGNSVAKLGVLGGNQTTFTFPALPVPALVGWTFNHAYVVLSGGKIVQASNPVSLTFIQ